MPADPQRWTRDADTCAGAARTGMAQHHRQGAVHPGLSGQDRVARLLDVLDGTVSSFRRSRMSDMSSGTGKVVVNRSMSLDGFIAAPGDAMDWIFDFVAPDAPVVKEIAAATGAMLVGRRTHEVGKRMNANVEPVSAAKDEEY